jgi:hypothetical protein
MRRAPLYSLYVGLALVALALAPAAASAQETGQSRNWSGYIASNAYYTGVSALIQVPEVTQERRLGVVSSWVGIGGVTTEDLIQAGVSATRYRGNTRYEAWLELLPQAARSIDVEVHPGDLVLVDIHEVGFNTWQGTIVNGTQVFQRRVVYESCHCNAEWIVEAPSLSGGRLLPLAGATGANMTQMSAISNSIPSTPIQLSAQPVQLVGPGGVAKAIPSAIGADDASFSVEIKAP